MSFWSARDPRAKAVFALTVSFAVAASSWTVAALVFPVVMVMFLTVKPGRRKIGNLVRGVLILWGLSFLANAFLIDGQRIGPVELGIFRPTREGMVMGLGQGARLGVLVAVSSWVAACTSALDLAGSLEWMLRKTPPLRRRAHQALLPIVLSLRLIPVFLDEAGRLREVDRLRRGPGTRAGVRELARLAPIWVSMVLERSEALALALTLRGYRPRVPRGFARGFRFGILDWGLMLGGVGGVVLVGRL